MMSFNIFGVLKTNSLATSNWEKKDLLPQFVVFLLLMACSSHISCIWEEC